MHFTKIKKPVQPSGFTSQPSAINTTCQVYPRSETDNLIKIRALIGKAFSPSESTFPTRYSMARINRSLTRNAIKSNYLALHRKKANLQQNLYNNTSLTNTSEDIREASIDLPKISVEKKKYFSYGCRIEDTNHENRRNQLIIRDNIDNERIKKIQQRSKGRLLKGMCKYSVISPKGRIIHNIKLCS